MEDNLEKDVGGRPTTYTKELEDTICEQIALGRSMRNISRDADMPAMSTLFKWLREVPSFSEHYELACAERTEAQHEDLLELGDEAIELSQRVDPKASGAVVQAVRLKADNIKWAMAKMKPKKYGDKVDVTTNGKDLPSPILFHALQHNDSNEEGTKNE